MPDPVTGISAGASILGGAMSSNAARDAANTQAAAADRAAALQKDIYDQQTALNAPYREAGLKGQNRMMDLLGLSGNTGAADYGRYTKDFGMGDFQEDPYQKYLNNRLTKNLGARYAASGLSGSGVGLRGLADLTYETSLKGYNDAYNRYQTNRANQLQPLGSLMASGQSAANQQGAQAGQYGTNVGNLMGQAGQSIAAGQLGAGNTLNNALGTAASAYQNQSNFNNFLAAQNNQRGLMGGLMLNSNPTYSNNMYGYMRDQ